MGLIMERYILVNYIPFFYIILSINYNNVNIKKGKETPTYLFMDLCCILNSCVFGQNLPTR